MFPYSGSRQLQHLLTWARDLRQRDEQREHTGEEGEQDGQQGSGDSSSQRSASQLSGLPVPPEPSLWQRLGSSWAGWAAELGQTLTGQPLVAAALVFMGLLMGVALTVLLFALTLKAGGSSGTAPDRQAAAAAPAAAGRGNKAAKKE
jgi:hypothetical protein